ncbi:MAG TPA: class I SAM-dependent methyltransferase [Chloroflexia bacterium]|nr:class I SAM-dependent methyltransferase [Chloroflexia bacterium]
MNAECRAGGAPHLDLRDGVLVCPRCGRVYPLVDNAYIDLMPPQEGAHESLYVSHEGEFEETLDYKRIGLPVLGAGVRQRAIRRMLKPTRSDRLIELGCGNGKFVYWNRKVVDWAVGIDPAPLFAKEAVNEIDLCMADARALPFGDGAFTAALSIDVLEHLPLPDFRLYLCEAHRVVAPGGRIFIFSNTREGSRLDFIVKTTRRVSKWLGERGVLDDSRDRLRKSDHVKAVETYPQLEAVLNECGWRVEKVIFWNGLFQSLIENLLVKLGESLVRRVRRGGRINGESAGEQEKGEDALRSSMRGTLAKRGWTYRAMRLLTELMWLDLALFGKWRAGPYFVLGVREDKP